MLKREKCPKCGGDVVVDSDWHGRYRQCLQCGHLRDMETTGDLFEAAGSNDRRIDQDVREAPRVATR